MVKNLKRSLQSFFLFSAGFILLFWPGFPLRKSDGELSALILPFILMSVGIYVARKKIEKFVMLSVFVFISLILAAFFYLENGENIYSYYPTFESAKNEGSIGEGSSWIPMIILSSATEIHEQHNLDTNKVWIRFNLPSNEKNKIISGLRKLSHQKIERIELRHPWRAGDWWFEGLIQQQPYNDNALNAEIYWADDLRNSFLAIDCCSLRVYYWDAL